MESRKKHYNNEIKITQALGIKDVEEFNKSISLGWWNGLDTKFNLLVVDDQMGVRRLIYETFSKDKYNVELAGSGLEALDKISQKFPDVILMDMKMPGMNGLEALKEIKKMGCNADIILMTAYGEVEIVSEAIELGVREYISKPFDIMELRRVVEGFVSAG